MHSVLENELSQLINKVADSVRPQETTPTPTPVAHVAQVPVVAPQEQPKVATPVVAPTSPAPTPAPVVDLNAPIEDWDTDAQAPAPAPVVAPAQPEASTILDLAKVLSLENVTSKEDAVKVVSELKQRAERLDKLPSDLSKAVEIASLGGNYLEYLNVSVVDWAKEDPIVLYENYVIDRYTDPVTNTVDYEKVDKLLDRIEDDEKELRGRELQSQYIMLQKQQQVSIEGQAKQAKAQFESSVKAALDSVNDIAGFRLSATNKTELLNDILAGKDLQHPDLKSRIEAAALRKYWGKLDSYRKTQIKNATERQMLEEATFPKLTSTSTPAAPGDPNQKYGPSDYIAELAARRGFK